MRRNLFLRSNPTACLRRHGLDYSGCGDGQVAGVREYGNGPSVAIKSGKLLDAVYCTKQMHSINVLSLLHQPNVQY